MDRSELKDKLVSAPILSYPDFSKPFSLETDASTRGIGTILSQQQLDGRLHPVAYVSRALSQQERNYAVNFSSCLGRLPFPCISLWA